MGSKLMQMVGSIGGWLESNHEYCFHKVEKIKFNVDSSFGLFRRTALTYEIILEKDPSGGQGSYVELIGCSFFTRKGAMKVAKQLKGHYARSNISTEISEAA